MLWNWQNPDWPNFTWDRTRIANAEEKFLLGSGLIIGSSKHLAGEQYKQLFVELLCGEAVTTSKIEGEIPNRNSVQSSIQHSGSLASPQTSAARAPQSRALPK